MDTMRDSWPWLRSSGRSLEADAVGRVLTFRRDASSAGYRISLDLEDIEELFSLATAGQRAGLEQDIKLAIAATLDYAQKTSKPRHCLLTLYDLTSEVPRPWAKSSHAPEIQRACPLYEFYLGRMVGCWTPPSAEMQNTVITFNYDLLVEHALRSLNVEYDYGFDPNTIETVDCPGHKTGANLLLLKLHGSVNWSVPAKGRASVDKVRTDKINLFSDFFSLRSREGEPELIPPSWSKVIAEPLSQVWSRAVESLKTATRVIILGYSMRVTDQHFKHLLAAGLQENISLRSLIVVNDQLRDGAPGGSIIRERASALFSPQLSHQCILHLEGSTISSFFSNRDCRRAINRRVPPVFSEELVYIEPVLGT